MGVLRGIVTAVLLILFLALIAWAWSDRRRATFDRLARMPLEEDVPAPATRAANEHGRRKS
ncbi:MAG: CcoQ/FixQ family Cbb3-type cytochrome c oxidase assembly chaperone [Steroidobacteraceae bacterium]